MKIHLRKASEEFSDFREIDGIPALLAIIKEFRCPLVLDYDLTEEGRSGGAALDVLIYDDYIE